MTESVASRFGSRKFLLALVVFAVASWFRVADLISAADWLKLATAVLAIYGIANVSQKIGTKTTAQPEILK